MKKLFLMLSVALLAVACNKVGKDPVFNGVTLTSEKYVALPEGGTSQITFKSTADWTTVVTIGAEFTDFVTVTPSSGKAGEECKISVVADDLPDGCTGRTFSVEIVPVDKTVSATAYFGQGKFFIGIPETETTVGIEGGKVSYHIFTNCTSYDIKKYDGPEDAFPYAPVTWDKATMTITMDFQPNTGYDERQAYVKFYNIDEIEDVRTYGYQNGRIQVTWSNSISTASYSSALGVGAIARLGYDGTNILLSSGSGSYYSIAPMTGSSTGSATLGDAYSSFATDDAGHIIYAKPAPYGDSTYVYAVINGATKEVAKIKKIEVYSFKAANFRVKGDVTGDACICGLTDMYVYCIWTEIKGGVQGDSGFFALPADDSMNWGSERNGCAMPLGSSIDAGVLYMGYDGRYTLCYVEKDGTSTALFSFDDLYGEGAGSNVNFQAISLAEWNGKQYAAVLVSTFFSCGEVPTVLLFNLTDKKLESQAYAANYGIETTYLGANDGENASADIILIPGETLGVVVVDVLSDVVFRFDYSKL